LTAIIRTVTSTLYRLFKYGVPSYILSFGESLGDNLLLTVMAKALFERGYKNIWIKCDQPALFDLNPYVKLIIPYKAVLSGTLLKIFKVKTASPRYTAYHPETDRDDIPEKHILLKMADELGIKGAVDLKPVFRLSEKEKAMGRIAGDQVVIITSGAAALFPMKNKEWIDSRYQQVIDSFRGKYTFIQLGSPGDTPLERVIDMRGKTSIRISAAILSQSVLMISHVGFMMHLARAVDCRSVILYGGREKPDQSGYAGFENLYSAIACAPCWLHNCCVYEKKCMQLIAAADVQKAANKQLQLAGQPLRAEVLINV
jgi:hypothetical protein